MPLYEYECTSCHRLTEKIQKFSDPELSVCPHCGGRLERTVTAAAVTFKGGGWYKDLYTSPRPSGEHSNGEGKADGSGGKAEPGTGSAGSAESAKPAATPAPTAAATPAAAPDAKA